LRIGAAPLLCTFIACAEPAAPVVSIALRPSSTAACACTATTDLSCLASVRLRLKDADGSVLHERCELTTTSSRTLGAPGLAGLFGGELPAAAQQIEVHGYGASAASGVAGACRGRTVFSAGGAMDRIEGTIALDVDCAYQCAAPPVTCPRQFCWSTPEPWPQQVDGEDQIMGGSIARHPDGEWLYVSTGLFNNAMSGGSKQARLRLKDRDNLDMATLERSPAALLGGDGYTPVPRFTGDDLELFFASSQPGGSWVYSWLHHASRASIDDDWPLATRIESLATHEGAPFYVQGGALLPDRRTLIYTEQVHYRAYAARRPSTRADDLAFERVGPVSFEDAAVWTVLSPSVSCDGWHVFYMRWPRGGGVVEARVAPILSHDPLIIGESMALPDLPTGTRDDSKGLTELHEAADCSRVYLSDWARSYVAHRRTCP